MWLGTVGAPFNWFLQPCRLRTGVAENWRVESSAPDAAFEHEGLNSSCLGSLHPFPRTFVGQGLLRLAALSCVAVVISTQTSHTLNKFFSDGCVDPSPLRQVVTGFME